MFDVEIANKLDALYDSINNRLIDADILPQIKLHTRGQQPSQPRPQAPPADDDEKIQSDAYTANNPGNSEPAGGNANPATDENNITGFARTAPPGGGYRQANHGAMQPGESGATAPPAGGEYQHYTAGMPAGQVGRVLGNYLGGTPITPGDRKSVV